MKYLPPFLKPHSLTWARDYFKIPATGLFKVIWFLEKNISKLQYSPLTSFPKISCSQFPTPSSPCKLLVFSVWKNWNFQEPIYHLSPKQLEHSSFHFGSELMDRKYFSKKHVYFQSSSLHTVTNFTRFYHEH